MPILLRVQRSIARRLNERRYKHAPATVSHLEAYLQRVAGRSGLEIGGPSAAFRPGNAVPIYDQIGSLDNCDFSADTVWAKHAAEFVYNPQRPAGSSFFCDGSALTPIADNSYDFVLSSHNLEHFANPVKALREWERVLRPGGALVLVLPYYRFTFDHKRPRTPVAHMLQDFERGTCEDDLTHLPEILEKHDLLLDPLAGSAEEFKQRSLDNIHNRCLHHHVFDEHNSRELLSAVGYTVESVDVVSPIHLCLLAHL